MPNFLTKIVKPNNSRDRTESLDSSSHRLRAHSSSVGSGSHQENLQKVRSSPQVPVLNLPDDGGPSVNVVPPTPNPSDPTAISAISFPSTAEGALPLPVPHKKRSKLSLRSKTPERLNNEGSPGRRTISFSSINNKFRKSDLKKEPVEDDVLTPRPENYRPSVDRPSSNQDPMLKVSSVLQRKSSSGSMRSQATAPSVQTIHARAATTPAPDHHNKETAPSPTQPPPPILTTSPEALTPTILVGSPETESPPLSLPSPSNSVPSNSNANYLSARNDTDAASISSSKKKKPWRRTSTKHMGLASALAASGMAMANPAVPMPSQSLPSSPVRKQSNAKETKSGKGSDKARKGSRNNSRKSSSQNGASRTRISLHSFDARSTTSLTDYDSADSRSFSASDRSDDDDDDDVDLDLDQDIPVTGFAVASSKRNADFHELFKNIPESEYLIEDYGCALQRDILIQGRLYISENHISFHANIFGWITDLSIPMYEITSLEKKTTALIIPNAIQIITRQAKYTFSSFLSRDTTFDVIYNIWRLARPLDASFEGTAGSNGSLDGAFRVGTDGGDSLGMPDGKALQHKATQCACSKDGSHLSETALETVFPGTPDRIHNLMFASGFIKDFLRVDQKLQDIQISDWVPNTAGSNLLARNMSYIKPLSGSLGPKQTKCELRDEVIYCDFDDYVTTLTTTRTPDVPSGGVFSVKTRTCIMWASAISSKVIVTCQVDWTGRSFIKGIIEKSALEGQKLYHGQLDSAMRMYIQEHQSEFIPEGIDPAAVAPGEPTTPGPEPSKAKLPLSESERERERNRRGLQWAWDTFEGASQVAKRSASGAIELIRDAWDQSTSTTILYFVIALLVISNLWTLIMMGSREEVGRRKEMKRMEEKEKWVQGVVKGLWEEMAAGNVPAMPGSFGHHKGQTPMLPPSSGDLKEDIASLMKILDAAEERVRSLKDTLAALD